MKKVLTIMLVITMVMSLAACGSKNGDSENPALGKYIGYQVDPFGWESIEAIDNQDECYIELGPGGRGIYCLNGERVKMRWKLKGETLTMRAEGQESKGTLEDDVITMNFFGIDITMTFVKEGAALPTMEPTTEQPVTEPATEQPATEPTAEPTTTAPADLSAYQDFWAGDWYGWWYISDGTKAYEDWVGDWWDCCVRIDLDETGKGYMAVWDEDGSADELMAELRISVISEGGFMEGRLVSEEGWFWDAELEFMDWQVDPDSTDFEHMVCVLGYYVDPEDPEDTFSYSIYIRPWGISWDDVEEEYPEDVPYRYYDWYLPAIESGMPMPDAIPPRAEA